MKTMSGKFFGLLTLCLIWAGVANAAADHSFIEGPLNSGPEVTKVCLECHEDAAQTMMKTSHWTWSAEQVIDGKRSSVARSTP